MTIFEATMIAEGQFELAGIDTPEQSWEIDKLIIEAYQLLIDTEVVWALQGIFGRTAANMIENGVCHPAEG